MKKRIDFSDLLTINKEILGFQSWKKLVDFCLQTINFETPFRRVTFSLSENRLHGDTETTKLNYVAV